MKSFKILNAGRERAVPAEVMGENLWFHFEGQTYSVPIVEKRKRKGVHSAAEEGELHAPMPGKLTQVTVKAGDEVIRGQVLIIMEAMKMEYSLKAGRDGKVLSVSAKIGDQVTLGQLLVSVGAK